MAIIRSALTILAASGMMACGEDEPVGMQAPEPTRFQVSVENGSVVYDFIDSGVFSTPQGAAMPGPVTPGGAYQFSFNAAPGHLLSLATMFVQSNDLFYAPDGAGIALYDDDGNPRSGDITDEILLWDAGTEFDQEPGLGSDQAPRQGGPDTGAADEVGTVRLAVDAFGNLPAVTDAIRVTLTYLGNGRFTLRIDNIATDLMMMTSTGEMVPVVISPGVYTVGSGTDALFTAGAADRGEGLEGVAEDGAVAAIGASASARTGVTSPLAPGAWAVQTGTDVLFTAGQADRGLGLEALAEDGDPSALAAALAADSRVSSAGAFNTPDGAAGPGPLLPGGAYSFQVEASPGERLTLATMFVQSNDLFYAPGGEGIELFVGDSPRSGDITSAFLLWDSGTEVNQAPGIGADQAPRQGGPDTGADEGGVVQIVNDSYVYPSVASVIRVTLTPLN